MSKYSRHCLSSFVLLIALAISYSNSIAVPPINSIPIPQDTLVVLLVRPAVLANDPQMKTMASNFDVIFQNIKTIGLSSDNVDEAVLFTPFNMGLLYGAGSGFPRSLTAGSGLILKGKFNADSKIRDLKSKGWKESQFDKKRVLFWTTGETYLYSPDGSECLATLTGDRIVIGGSQVVVKDMINAANGKIASLDNDPFYKRISDQFAGSSAMGISLFSIVTDRMRDMIKPPSTPADTTGLGSKAAAAAIASLRSYSSHVKELGLSISASGAGYQLGGLFSFDNESSAMLVTSLLQFSGGLISFLPPNDPARAVITGLQVSRDGAVLNLQSPLTRQQFIDMFVRRR